MSNLISELTDLFLATGHAHHAAFIDTDGVDPEWPLWYADYLLDKLPPKLGAQMTKSEIVYMLVYADRHLKMNAPGANWPGYYARLFVERYGR